MHVRLAGEIAFSFFFSSLFWLGMAHMSCLQDLSWVINAWHLLVDWKNIRNEIQDLELERSLHLLSCL